MKTFITERSVIELRCPHCGEYVESPDNGSFLIYREAAAKLCTSPTLECASCKQQSKLPQSLRRLAGIL